MDWKMKRTIAALTTRGRSFAAAGVTAILCAFVLGERDLLRAGLLVLALPLLSAITVSRTRYRLACARRLEPSRLPVGHEARVDLRLENVSRLPTGLLLVEDRVPYALGAQARFVLDRIEPHGARELSYRVRSDVRGRYRVGPLSVRLADPFGLVELDRSFSLSDTLTVTPALVPLPRGRVSGAWTGSGESRARTMSSTGDDDIAPREYRQGDDLRRVHWRSTARYGELMVRREEQHWQSSGSVFLDTRRRVHRGEGPASSFEQAVSVTASIGIWLSQEGLGLRLVTDTGETLSPSSVFDSALLDVLATVRTSDARSLTAGLTALRAASGSGREGDGLVVGVFAALDAAEARSVAMVRRGNSTCVAVLVDVTAQQGAPPDPSTRTAADILRAAGWRVVIIPSAGALASVWATADQAAENAGLNAVRHRVTGRGRHGREDGATRNGSRARHHTRHHPGDEA
ncbi:DUF58 domain-containing protein [Actinomadura alba]